MNRLRDLAVDERGSAMVVAVLLMLSLTGGSIVWLTRDLDRTVAAAAEADAVAFQAARAGAQAIEPASLRTTSPAIDPAAARQLAVDTAAAMFTANGTIGRVIDVAVAGDRITVTVEINEADRLIEGRSTARITPGIIGADT